MWRNSLCAASPFDAAPGRRPREACARRNRIFCAIARLKVMVHGGQYADRTTRYPQPIVREVRRAVRRRRDDCPARQWRVANLVLHRGTQSFADPHPARAGRGRGGKDRSILEPDRVPARLDCAVALDGKHTRTATDRRLAPVSPGSGHHRTQAAGPIGPRTTACLPAGRSGRAGKWRRLLQGSQVSRGSSQQEILWPGLLPEQFRALSHALACGRGGARA